MDHGDCCDALEVEVERFALAMESVPSDIAIASCPGWTLDDLAFHLGVIHRWAEELVRTRSSTRIARTARRDDVDVTPAWMREGGSALVSTLRLANPDDPMWAWGQDQHVRFWSRRQLHETLVHRMDAELATSREPEMDPSWSSDAVDEFLSNLEKGIRSTPDSPLRGNGERLGFRATDTKMVWAATLDPNGFQLTREELDFDAEIEGPSTDLLLVLCRRRTLHDSRVTRRGEDGLAHFWLEHTSFD